MARADFHTHSTHSDGILGPADLVARAAAHGVQIMALTDHDTSAGVAAAVAAGQRLGVQIIPGIELSTDLPEGGDAHILGYFRSVDRPGLQQQLQELREGRQARGRDMLAKLEALGMPLQWESVLAIAGEAAVGRPHVARAMIERGYVPGVREAFDRYLHTGGPADAEREKHSPAEAVALIRAEGGVAVLAHPSFLPDPDAAVQHLRAVGLEGIEVYYKNYPPEEVDRYRRLGEAHGLLLLGGSDFHGIHDDECEPGAVPLPDTAIDAFMAYAETRWAVGGERGPE